MKIALITDAWQPQVNGVVTTLVELVRELELIGHQIEVIHPGQFKTRPCPGYAGVDPAVRPGQGLAVRLQAFAPEAIHIATEGPLGWAARRYCLQRKLRFTTAFHSLCGGGGVCVSQQVRNIWPGHARSHGVWHTGGGLPGGRPS